MSFDVAHLRAVVTSVPSSDLDSRCRSIARNAVQASREAHGRGNALYTDDEAKRESMIEKILHLDLSKYEGGPNDGLLVASTQPSDPLINVITGILDNGIESIVKQVAGPTEAPTSASAPVEPASPPRSPKPAQNKA